VYLKPQPAYPAASAPFPRSSPVGWYVIRWLTALVVIIGLVPPAEAARVKDLAALSGVRTNALTGYGLVVGLERTGDTEQSLFTVQSVAAMLTRMGVRVDPKRLRIRNVAAVMVTAKLPPFASSGIPIDVVVSSIGNATSLRGGTLLASPLKGVDGQVYAIAQGPVAVGGYNVRASGSRRQKNITTVGRIPSGATVEKSVEVTLNGKETLTYVLRQADFTTATNVAAAITAAGYPAKALDGARIQVDVPEEMRERVPELVAQIESADVSTDAIARIVVNARTGTVVIGSQVRIGTVAIAHGGLTIQVDTRKTVSQPAPLGAGSTATVAESDVTATESAGVLHVVKGGATLDDLVAALNALGATPRDLIEIIQAIRSSGALNAEIEIQ
jgi:flagellar P-ring protein precursor FlgI